jgi:hypothetical protein
MPDERRAFIRLEDGREVDMTDALKVLYDGIIDSLEWGSGYWDGEDAAAVGWIGLSFRWAVGARAMKHARDIQRFEKFRDELAITLPVVRPAGDNLKLSPAFSQVRG